MPASNKDKLDVTRFVAIGDSITSGYVDGALCFEGQRNSYANILANQFKLLGGGDFKQPLVSEYSVGIGFTGNACLVLENNAANYEPTSSNLSYIAANGDGSIFSTNIFSQQGPFNNLGVPGIKAIDIVKEGLGNPENGPGKYNPFFTRMARNYKMSSVLSDAVQMDPTFFSVFIGNNDALAFGLSGGTSDSISPLGGVGSLKESIFQTISALASNGSKGVIANLAGMASIPFFTAIPYNGLFLSAKAALELNKQYEAMKIIFREGENAFVLNDPNNAGERFRQLQDGDLVLMDVLLDKEKMNYLTGQTPIPKKYVLNVEEISKIEKAISEYNDVIRSIAEEKKIAFVDVHSLMQNLKDEMVYDISSHHMHYKSRSVFSLDGLHPTAFGQALLANEFIRSINDFYGVEIPHVKILNYKGISLS